METLHLILKAARLRCGLTQIELAAKCGLKNHSIITKYEDGSRRPCAYTTLPKICQALGLELVFEIKERE